MGGTFQPLKKRQSGKKNRGLSIMAKHRNGRRPNPRMRSADKVADILRNYINKTPFGKNSIKRSKTSDICLYFTLLFITQPRNFLYYDTTEAINQIDGLRKSAQAFLNDIEKLNPQLRDALSKEMASIHSKKSILKKAGPMPTVSRTSSFVHDLQKALINQREIYEFSQFPGIRRGKGRPRNQFAHDVAERVAIYYFHHKQQLPGTGTNALHSPFQNRVKLVFTELKVRADSRRACESALSKLRKKI
jgi:hypothetical protein